MNQPPPDSPYGSRAAPPRESTWGTAVALFRANMHSILAPAMAVLGPLSVLFPLGLAYLYTGVWPEAELDTFSTETDPPNGFIFGSMLLVGVSGFITAVGLTAVVVAAFAAWHKKPVSLPEALDPAFTRMGGLLILSGLLAVLVLLTSVGIFVMAYFILRFGLAFHVYILEDVGAGQSLRRCWSLLRGRMMRFFSLCLSVLGLTFLFATVLAFFTASILQVILLPFTGETLSRDANVVVVAVMAGVTWMGMIPLFAFFTTLITVFYIKAREETPA